MAKTYTVSEEEKKRFAGIYLLEYMINTPYTPPLFLEGNDQDLETILEWLMAERLVTTKDDAIYIPTQNGREHLVNFMARYSEYLTVFDIFSAVDLQSGEFAFERWKEFDTDEAFHKYLDDPRWDDLRVAVADYKKMNPVEIVFMSFISERRFGRNASGWQFDLLLGSVWDEILEICNSAVQWKELGYEDDQGVVKAKDVIKDIIRQGTDIMLELLGDKAPKAISANPASKDAEYFVDEVETPEFSSDYYAAYRDPKYVSKNWK